MIDKQITWYYPMEMMSTKGKWFEMKTSMDKINDSLNECFVNNIVALAKEEVLSRKRAFKRWGIDGAYYCSDSFMQEVFLKSYAKAYNKIYGFAKIYGIDPCGDSAEDFTGKDGKFIDGGLSS
jgi:hypothetical protein